MLTPSRDVFLSQAAGRRMPVVRDVLGDMETPLGAYWKLAHDARHSFLLESVTGGEQLARYSLLGVRPRRVLRARGDRFRWHDGDQTAAGTLRPGEDPLHELARELFAREAVHVPGLPKFCGGAVGMVGYDFVRFLERLPGGPGDDLGLDDLAMMLCDTVVVFDHAKNLIRVMVNAQGAPEAFAAAVREIEWVLGRLRGPLPPLPRFEGEPQPVRQNLSRKAFEDAVRRLVEYVAAGDGVQFVPSIRFSTRTGAHPLNVYRSLRSLNPSPYMFLLRFGDFDLVGASPELHVGLIGGVARVRPIAGTRPRGADDAGDASLERELLADEKERAEHIMLVDLGRNDLGRVCEFGSVRVNELMAIERYSHVMHIVSDVTGRLRPGESALDLLRATFPAGTVTGAPKVRAMQIIDEVEPARRGLYAGAVGYIGYDGEMDTAIAIRSVLLKDGVAHVQAGAGVVFDSIPANEYEECRAKAQAALRAIEIAQTGLQGAL
jgi:anthranilate synthase component 1